MSAFARSSRAVIGAGVLSTLLLGGIGAGVTAPAFADEMPSAGASTDTKVMLMFMAPVAGQAVTDGNPEIRGFGAGKVTVTYTATGESMTAEADGDYNWSIPGDSFSWKEGTATLVVKDEVGQSDTRSFEVRSANPPLSLSGDGAHRLAYSATPTIWGKGPVGATITLTNATDGSVLGATTVESDGEFQVAPSHALPDGNVTVRVSSSGGGASIDQPFTIDTRPTIITTPTEGSTVIDAGSVTVSGTSAANKSLRIVDGRRALASITADSTGNWSVTFDRSDVNTYFGAGRLTVLDGNYNGPTINITWSN